VVAQPEAIEWPQAEVGESTIAAPVTVSATEAGAHVAGVSLAGADAGDFTILGDGCTGRTLTPVQRCQVRVGATPVAAGPRTARLVVTDTSGAVSEVTLAVTGAPITSRDVTMVSTPGDWVGGGTDRIFDLPGSVSLSGGPSKIEVHARSGGDSFDFQLVAPAGSQLQPGDYEQAERSPFQEPGRPGLTISGDARGCNADTGRFLIKDIHFDEAGKVDRLSALYEQRCEETATSPLFGELRIEPPSAGPETAFPTAVDWPATPVGEPSIAVPVVVTGQEPGAKIASIGLAGEDAGDFAVLSDGCEGEQLAVGSHCTVEVQATPIEAGPRAAELIVHDESGASSSIPLTVQATAP
jgi:hypothetical protein